MADILKNICAPGTSFTAECSAAVEQYDVVKLHTVEAQVLKTANANEAGVGVCKYAQATAGGEVSLVRSGVFWCRASAAIALGANVTATTDGEIVTQGTTAATVYQRVGIALSVAAAANDVIPVLLTFDTWTTAA
jgi:hypothetical protein